MHGPEARADDEEHGDAAHGHDGDGLADADVARHGGGLAPRLNYLSLSLAMATASSRSRVLRGFLEEGPGGWRGGRFVGGCLQPLPAWFASRILGYVRRRLVS